MASRSVADLRPKGEDAMGVTIMALYGLKPPDYAVYRTCERVLLHYADAKDVAQAQRKAMARLNPVRGEINGLIDGWRSSSRAHLRRKAERYDRRVGDALVVALEDDIPSAEALLERIKRDILHERISWARFEYLITAFLTAVTAMVLMAAITRKIDYHDMALELWRAAAAGTIGAFFSISLGIRNRTVLPDLQRAGNLVDAMLRILIGLIAAAVLISLMRSGAVTIKIGDAELVDPQKGEWLFILLIGFLAGFSERFVPDLLDKVGASTASAADDKTSQQPSSTTAQAPAAGDKATAPATSSTPTPPANDAVDDAEADEDNCACDIALDRNEVVDDADLPAAAGGVAKPEAGGAGSVP